MNVLFVSVLSLTKSNKICEIDISLIDIHSKNGNFSPKKKIDFSIGFVVRKLFLSINWSFGCWMDWTKYACTRFHANSCLFRNAVVAQKKQCFFAQCFWFRPVWKKCARKPCARHEWTKLETSAMHVVNWNEHFNEALVLPQSNESNSVRSFVKWGFSIRTLLMNVYTFLSFVATTTNMTHVSCTLLFCIHHHPYIYVSFTLLICIHQVHSNDADFLDAHTGTAPMHAAFIRCAPQARHWHRSRRAQHFRRRPAPLGAERPMRAETALGSSATVRRWCFATHSNRWREQCKSKSKKTLKKMAVFWRFFWWFLNVFLNKIWTILWMKFECFFLMNFLNVFFLNQI